MVTRLASKTRQKAARETTVRISAVRTIRTTISSSQTTPRWRLRLLSAVSRRLPCLLLAVVARMTPTTTQSSAKRRRERTRRVRKPLLPKTKTMEGIISVEGAKEAVKGKTIRLPQIKKRKKRKKL